MFQESGLHCWSQSKLNVTEKHAVCLTDRGAQSCVHLSLVPGLAGVGARPPVGGWGKPPPWGVAPDRQKKVPWTTLTSLSASRQVSTVQEAFSFYTQDCYPFLFVFLHNGFLSLVLSSFYTNDCYPSSFRLFTQRIVTLCPFIFLHKGFFILAPLNFLHQVFLSFVFSSIYTNDFYPFAFIFIHTGFLSLLLLSFFTQRIFIVGSFFLHK